MESESESERDLWLLFSFFFFCMILLVGWLVYMFLSWRGIFKIYMCVCELLLCGGGFIII